jgi:hypothetical protein
MKYGEGFILIDIDTALFCNCIFPRGAAVAQTV